MALLKTELIYNGETVSYHKVAECAVDMATGAATATLHSFNDSDSRRQSENPVLKRSYNFQRTGEHIAADAYAAIKALPEWADAQDI